MADSIYRTSFTRAQMEEAFNRALNVLVEGKRFNIRGAWVAEESYANTETEIDVVLYDSTSYYCLVTHSGQTDPPDVDTTNWAVLAGYETLIKNAEDAEIADADTMVFSDASDNQKTKKTTWATIKGIIKSIVTKADVGLGNVDNTSDADKPISTAAQAALDLKLNSASYTAGDVLNKLKTVDGHGSGLDADKLDGKEASDFVPTTDIVDDLTTGGSDKVLSAEQGKVLKGLVDDNAQAISELAEQTSFEMTNLVANGNFAGTDNWTLQSPDSTSLSVSDNVGKITITDNTGAGRPVLTNSATDIFVGHKYFFSYSIKFTSGTLAAIQPRPLIGGYSTVTSISNDGQWHIITDIVTASNPTQNQKVLYIAETLSSFENGDTIEYKNYTVIDLTATFGTGNEPTAREINALLSLFPNGWFDGEITLTQKQILIWTLNLIRANTNAIVAMGGTIV